MPPEEAANKVTHTVRQIQDSYSIDSPAGQEFKEGGSQQRKFGDEMVDQNDGAAPGLVSQMSLNSSQMGTEMIQFAKEFFITEKGEVIKMAALLSRDEDVLDKLSKQKPVWKQDMKKLASNVRREHYISIYKVQNVRDLKTSLLGGGDFDDEDLQISSFTVIVFHVQKQVDQEMLVKNTQYCVVGNYLCHRYRHRQEIWVTKLKENVNDLIQASRKDTDLSVVQSYKSICLSIDKMTRKVMVPHIQLTEVAKANFTTVKTMKSNNRMEFYDNLLQVTIGNDGMIFDLDSEPIMEVNSVENIDQLAKPDSFTNTGCIMSISTNALHEGEKVIERVQVFTNENANLLFEKRQKRFEDGKRINNISGMLYRSFSELDL